MKCEIIRDLLPNYADGLSSEATNEAVEEHLGQCVECREYYEEMCGGNLEAVQDVNGSPQSGNDIRVIRKFRRTKLRWIAISCAVILVFVLFLSKAAGSWIELSYEDAGIIASVQPAELDVPDSLSSEGTDGDGSDERLAEEIAKEMEENGDGYVVRVTQKDGGKSVQWVDFRLKVVEEDGAPRYLVFINCKNTLWEQLFARRTINGDAPVVEKWSGFEVDGEKQGETGAVARTVPISATDAVYYLDKGIEKIDEADAGEVEELIAKYGTLMWEKE